MTDSRVKMQTVGDYALKAEVEIRASPERVFAAWTDPAEIPRWLRPREDITTEVNHCDCTAGGRYELTMIFADGDRVQITGIYKDVVPSQKLVFTWQWKDSPTLSYETLVTLDLAPTEAGTLLTLTHERFTNAKDCASHMGGWEPILARLATDLIG